MSKSDSENRDLMGFPPSPKTFKQFIVWAGHGCGLVRVERVDEEALTVKDIRKIARAILEEADKVEEQVRPAEAQDRVEAVREALREGRAGEALNSLERRCLRRVSEGGSLLLWQVVLLFEMGLITEDGKHLTEDGEQALRQLVPTGETGHGRRR